MNTNSRHTTGPWVSEKSGRIVHIKGADGFYPATVAGDCGEPVSQANARLIAAAPELLAALEELVLRCDGEEGVRADGSNIQTMRAHAIIMKAKGEQE